MPKMAQKIIRQAYVAILAFGVFSVGGCGYNTLASRDEAVKAAWSQVLNVYRKRADLVPNLVNVVQGYASHEKDVLVQVTQARASVGQMKMPDRPENATEEDLKRFDAQQREMSSALSRLLVTVERYPDLKADKNFLDLQHQLTEIENQIAASRNRYIREVRGYNTTVRSFPVNLTAMMFDHKVKPQLDEGDQERIRKVPEVKFGNKG